MQKPYLNSVLSDTAAMNLLREKLNENSKAVYGFTDDELQSIIEYDALRIIAYYYHYMDVTRRELICELVAEQFMLGDATEIFEIEVETKDDFYIPCSCRLIDRIVDQRVSALIFSALFETTKEFCVFRWDKTNSFSNYLSVMNAAYFQALANVTNLRAEYIRLLDETYSYKTYTSFIDNLYKTNVGNNAWNVSIDFDRLDRIIEESRRISLPRITLEECNNAVIKMNSIRRRHALRMVEDGSGMESIQNHTGIMPHMRKIIDGFECFFCMAKNSIDEYVIVFQRETRLNKIIEDEMRWQKFQKDLYYANIQDGKSNSLVYIIYILDADSNNLPIQAIESNRTYGRKYVFTEEETITFINGIVKTSSAEAAAVSPVQEWDKILRKEHLTGCMTEAYSAKRVNSYLDGERFDAEYISEDEYNTSSGSNIPQIKWVKSLNTTGFREFCFDDAEMEFGQINLFFGSNGSGKTSVLEAIEYALTSEVRRVKDFKVKLPSIQYPTLKVYDTESGIHTFNPAFSKKNSKEIERIWYGVPSGRTKTNLNDNFNRFNSFDSEAAYKFIHSADNDADGFATMFGNLMFGETVVGYEKKWQRFKKAFDEVYSELRDTLSNAKFMKELYQHSLESRDDTSHSKEIEDKLKQFSFKKVNSLPKGHVDRYSKIKDELCLIQKYVEYLEINTASFALFSAIDAKIVDVKTLSARYQEDRKEKNDRIAQLAAEHSGLQRKIFDNRKVIDELERQLIEIDKVISDWAFIEHILNNTETIELIYDLGDELEALDRELLYISKIEQRTSLIRFLQFDSFVRISSEERMMAETELHKLISRQSQLEHDYEEKKLSFGKKEQQTIELRKIGKTLLRDTRCPLCGTDFESSQELLQIIDSSVVVDTSIDGLITELENINARIRELEKSLNRETVIDRAMSELELIANTVPMVSECGTDYMALRDYVSSKSSKESRKAEIVEQQIALSAQGFSIKNVNACYEFKSSNSLYLDFMKSDMDSFSHYLSNKLDSYRSDKVKHEESIANYEQQMKDNNGSEEILRDEIREIDIRLGGLDIDAIREIEQALTSIRLKFNIDSNANISEWITNYHTLYDLIEMEVHRIETESNAKFDKEMLAHYSAIIERETPRVERCACAVQAFERMPSLNSFVENGIRNNIQQISKFFRWMHHSGEFVKLGIDNEGIYAVRGVNNEIIRTYQMSTGQRSTIAMAVMFALHIAAPDAPQFLLLDEPLATMDDTQVLNVLDILKSMAEQNTQIFFTTANGVMINLFKECFRGTDFDYKEFHFIKMVNHASSIKVSSINSVKTIAELTFDDLTLDFHQFAQIREILRKNQEKLIDSSEWEELPSAKEDVQTISSTNSKKPPNNFYSLLPANEQELLDTFIVNHDVNSADLSKVLQGFSSRITMIERINEKAVDFFGETIINSDGTLPYLEPEYIDILLKYHDEFDISTPSVDANSVLEQRTELEAELRKATVLHHSEKERRIALEEELRVAQDSLKAESNRIREDMQHQNFEALRQRDAEQQRLEEERQKAEEARLVEEERRIALEEELRIIKELFHKEGDQLKANMQRQNLEIQQQYKERQRLEEERQIIEEARLAEEERRITLEEELRITKELFQKEGDRLKADMQRQNLEIQQRDVERQHLEEERQKAEEARRIEAERRIILEEELRTAKELYQQENKKLLSQGLSHYTNITDSDEVINRSVEDYLKQERQRQVALEAKLHAFEEQHRLDVEQHRIQEQQRDALQEKLNFVEEQQRLKAERRKAEKEKRARYRRMNICQHCGGKFVGLINKKCSMCGKVKDY